MSFLTAPVALRRLERAARTRELRIRGVTARELARAVHFGEVLRVRQGVYALPDTPDAVIHAASHGGVAACTDAARLYGLWVLNPDTRIHVWLGDAGHQRHCCSECRMHWSTGTPVIGELPPLPLVLCQIAECHGEEALFVALESARRKLLLSKAELRWLRHHIPKPLRWLVSFSRDDADSGLESLLRLRLYHLGIGLNAQVFIHDVGIVDFVLGDRLIIECDGEANHGGIEKRHKDLLRDSIAAELGYETLRFDYAMIVHDWPRVAAAVQAKIASGAHLR